MLEESINYGRIYNARSEKRGNYDVYSFELDTCKVYGGKSYEKTLQCQTFRKEVLNLKPGTYIFVRGASKKDGDSGNYYTSVSEIEQLWNVPDRQPCDDYGGGY